MSLKGKKVVFTGKLSKTRAKMKAEAEAAGIDVDTTISSKTDMLVCGPQIAHNATNSKHKKATKLNVEIVLEDEYRRRLTGATEESNPTDEQTNAPNIDASSLASWFNSQSKFELRSVLSATGDTAQDSSWSKAQLIDQISSKSMSVIIDNLTAEQCSAVLIHLGSVAQGSQVDQQETLRGMFNITSSRTTKLLALLDSEDEDTIRQGLALFEALGAEDQNQLLSQFPMTTKDGTAQWDNQGKHKVLEDSQTPSLFKNHMSNIGFVLHCLADHPKLKSIKKAQLWLFNSMSAEFIELLNGLSSLEKLKFQLALNENFFVEADEFLNEIKALPRSKTFSLKYLPLVGAFPTMKTLTLVGDLNESKPKFSQLLLLAEITRWSFNWQNWYSAERAHTIIDENRFPKLKNLTIKNSPIMGRLNIDSDVLDSLHIEHAKSLCFLNSQGALKQLHIKDSSQLKHMQINTNSLSRYTLNPGLDKDVSAPVNLSNRQEIQEHLESQDENFLQVLQDYTYGFSFTGDHAHLTHSEAWVECSLHESSFSYFLDYLKQKIRAYCGETDLPINDFCSSDRCELWTEEFNMDNTCTTACGYDMDFYETASWKNRAMNTCPEVNCKRPKHDHTSTAIYPILESLISDDLSTFFAEELIQYIAPEELSELNELYGSSTR